MGLLNKIFSFRKKKPVETFKKPKLTLEDGFHIATSYRDVPENVLQGLLNSSMKKADRILDYVNSLSFEQRDIKRKYLARRKELLTLETIIRSRIHWNKNESSVKMDFAEYLNYEYNNGITSVNEKNISDAVVTDNGTVYDSVLEKYLPMPITYKRKEAA